MSIDQRARENGMRGVDVSQPTLFITNTVSGFVPNDHPLRKPRVPVDEALGSLEALFDTICADIGKASVARERLSRASLLQALLKFDPGRASDWVKKRTPILCTCGQ